MVSSGLSVGQLVYRARAHVQMEQKALAIDLGCDAAHISKIEHDERMPSPDMAIKLERVLKLKPGTLLEAVLVAQLHNGDAQTIPVLQIVRAILTRLKIPTEDMTLLTEPDWSLLRSIVEPVVTQLLRQRAQSVRHHHRMTNKFIFIVEDDRKQCLELTDFLHQQGFKTDYALDGREALKRIVSHRVHPDLILLDLRMPKLNGIKLLKRLQQQLKLRSKILVITAYPGDMGEVLADPNLKTDGIIEKPIQTGLLQEKIEQLLR